MKYIPYNNEENFDRFNNEDFNKLENLARKTMEQESFDFEKAKKGLIKTCETPHVYILYFDYFKNNDGKITFLYGRDSFGKPLIDTIRYSEVVVSDSELNKYYLSLRDAIKENKATKLIKGQFKKEGLKKKKNKIHNIHLKFLKSSKIDSVKVIDYLGKIYNTDPSKIKFSGLLICKNKKSRNRKKKKNTSLKINLKKDAAFLFFKYPKSNGKIKNSMIPLNELISIKE